MLTASVEPNTPGTFTFELPGGGTQTGNEITVIVESTGVYQVSFMDENGCATQTTSVTIETAEPAFQPEVIATDINGVELGSMPSIVRGGTVILSVANAPDGFDGSFTWTGDGTPASAEGQTVTVMAPSSMDVATLNYTVRIEDPNGCSLFGNISIELSDEVYKIPEIISANRDGLNDNFQVFFQPGAAVSDYNLIVFNRWGQNVFETTDPSEGWDGTNNGKPQNLDTYLYVARFTVDGREVDLDGQFTLVR